MQTIVFLRGGGYLYGGVQFDAGVPRTVDDDVAEYLLSTGKFQVASTQAAPALEAFGIDPFTPPPDYIRDPKNQIAPDDSLSGKRILLRRSGGIGDIVFAAVTAECIKSRYSECAIDLAVQEEALDFAGSFDVFDRVITTNMSTVVEVAHSYHYIIPLAGVLGSESVSTVDDTDYYRAHFDRVGLNEEVPSPLPPLRIMNLVANRMVQSDAQSVLNRCGIMEDPYVVLVLGTSNPLKMMHPNQIRDIANGIASSRSGREGKDRFKVLCIGGKSDRLFENTNPWVSIETDLSLITSAELVRRSRCVIGSDTGFLHFAAAIGVPTVGLWGPTDPDLTMPHYAGGKKVITPNTNTIRCSPCKRLRTSHCRFFNGGYADCMKSHDAKHVVRQMHALLDEYPTHPYLYLTSEEAVSVKQHANSGVRVGILLDNADNFTGGGYYAWMLAKVLAGRPNFHVTVITDAKQKEFVYTTHDILPPSDRFSILYDRKFTDFDTSMPFDLIIGTPPFTGVRAVEYAKKHKGVMSVVLLYETPNYIREYRDGLDTEEEYWAEYKTALLDCHQIWTISKEVKEKLREWMGDESYSAWVIAPPVNQEVADKVLEEVAKKDFSHKTDSVVMIARNMRYKRLRESLSDIAAFAEGRSKKVDVVVIGHGTKRLRKFVLDSWNINASFHENLPDDEKWKFLAQAKVVLHPSDFEGFGIPVAEGLYAGARVIAHPLRVLQDVFGDMIAYYSGETELVAALAEAFSAWDSIDNIEEDVERESGEHITANARHMFALRRFSFSVCRGTATVALQKMPENLIERSTTVITEEGAAPVQDTTLRVAMVTPWNVRCGIAETTKQWAVRAGFSYRVFSYTDDVPVYRDRNEVVRCWDRKFKTYSMLVSHILEWKANIVHIQHESSIYQDSDNLLSFIRKLKEYGIKVVLTLHTYMPSRFVDSLATIVDRLILTKEIVDSPTNTTVIPLPTTPWENKLTQAEAREVTGFPSQAFVVGSFGFWQAHKGFLEFMRTYNDVSYRTGDNTYYMLTGNCPPKSQYYAEARRKCAGAIQNGKIKVFHEFADMEQVLARLATCDVLVFNYNVVHHISASAAIRTGMSVGVPIICTHSPMFSEFEDGKQVLKVEFGNDAELEAAILKLHADPDLRKSLGKESVQYVQQHTDSITASRHEALYRELVFSPKSDEEEVTT